MFKLFVVQGFKSNVFKLKLLMLFCGLNLAIVSAGCSSVEQDIAIPRAQVQQMVAKKFPFTKNVVVAMVTLDSPQVYFQADKIGIQLRFSGNFLGKPVTGSLDFNGNVVYKPETGSFHLTNLKIVSLTVNDPNFKGKATVISTVEGLLGNYLQAYPIFTLDSNDTKQNVAKLLLKRVTVKGDNLVVTFGP